MKPRTPPHSPEAETALLAYLLRRPDSLDDVVLEPAMFYRDDLKVVFESMLELRREGTPVDAVTLGARLSLYATGVQPTAVLDELASIDAENPDAYAAIIRDKWQRRQAIAAAQTTIDECYAADNDVIDRAAYRFTELAAARHTASVVTAGDALEEALKTADDTSTPAGLTTGLQSLDRVFFHRDGELTILAGRPGMAKSARAFENAAQIAALGEPALCFSLEMPLVQCSLRLACQLANVNLAKVLAKQHTFEERSRLADAKKKMDSWPLYLDEKPAASLGEIRAKSRKLDRELARKKKRLRFIVIDYLQLMGGMDDEDTRDQGIGLTTRGLKQFAKEMQLPVLLLSQLNRSVEDTSDKRPTLRHLRESGSIEQDADNILFLYRDEYYNKQTKLKGTCEVIIGKQRNGPSGGSYHVGFDGATTSFRELTEKERLLYGLPKEP